MARTSHLGINLILMGYHGKSWEIKEKLRYPARNLGIILWISLLCSRAQSYFLEDY